MRRIFVVALMSAGLLAANAASSTAEAWDRGHGRDGGGYSHHGGSGYPHRSYGPSYYVPSYSYYAPSYDYRPYYPPYRHHRHHPRPHGGWR